MFWMVGLLFTINLLLAGVCNSLWVRLRAARRDLVKGQGCIDRLLEERGRLLEERGRLLEAQAAAFRESMDRVNQN